MEHFQWGGIEDGGYGSHYFYMVEDKSYGNLNP